MRIRFDLRCFLLISAFMFSLSLCRAQTTVPTTVTAGFGTNDGTQIWDLTGDYSVSATVTLKNGITVPLTVDFHLVQDAVGNLSGVPGDFRIMDLNGNAFAVSYRVTGKVTGSGGAARTRFTVRFTGNGQVGSLQTTKISAVLVVNASPNPEDGQLEPITTTKFSAHFTGGLESINGTLPDFAPALPLGVDGTWTLNMQLLGGRSLDGSATITTDAGQIISFTVTGPLNSSGAVARLRGSRALIGGATMSGAGASVTIFSDVAFDDFTVNGKVMGQKLLAIPGP
ncbi:MAG TPA: hypothetical protein VKV04_11050 [Verrucomicrobiae bacterium]|nr:hypothetical protein [Verrucomicrobiae bacterium]